MGGKGGKMLSIIIMVLRQALLVAGGALISKGIFSDAEWTQIVGVIVVIVVAMWRWIEAWIKAKKVTTIQGPSIPLK
jgi:hypothetical protein